MYVCINAHVFAYNFDYLTKLLLSHSRKHVTAQNTTTCHTNIFLFFELLTRLTWFDCILCAYICMYVSKWPSLSNKTAIEVVGFFTFSALLPIAFYFSISL